MTAAGRTRADLRRDALDSPPKAYKHTSRGAMDAHVAQSGPGARLSFTRAHVGKAGAGEGLGRHGWQNANVLSTAIFRVNPYDRKVKDYASSSPKVLDGQVDERGKNDDGDHHAD